MSIEFSDQSGTPFTELSLSERREVARAIHRAEHLDAARGAAHRLADEAQAIEAGMASRGITDPNARREAAEAVAAAVSAERQLTAEVQDYRGLLEGDTRSSRALGQYVVLLQNARSGDLEALASVRTAQAELAEARDANAAVDQYGRYVVRDLDGLALDVTNSAGAAMTTAQKRGPYGAVVYDREEGNTLVGIVRRGAGDEVAERYAPGFEAAANSELNERGKARSTPGARLAIGDEREPEQTIVGYRERTVANELTPLEPKADSFAQATELERAARAQQAIAYPDGFDRRYLRVGERVVDMQDRDRVLMVDKVSRLTTDREFDSETVRLMVDTARARGWSDVVVRGSDEFRKAAWTAAVTQGIDVKGYEPTASERAWAERQRENSATKSAASQDVASAFRSAKTAAERKEAVERHPELVRAFALDAAVSSFAKRIQGVDGQNAFQARMREHIAEDLATGRPIVEVRLRERINEELRRDQNRGQDRGQER